MKIKKSIICIMFFLIIIQIQTVVYGKYVIEETYAFAKISTDEIKPVIEMMSYTNSNKNYTNYANKMHTIKIKINVLEKNIHIEKMDMNNINVIVGNKILLNKIESIKEIDTTSTKKVYEIILKDLTGDGILKLEFQKGCIVDIAGNESELTTVSTGITIDNIAPNVTFQETKLNNGKVKAKIIANESIRNKNGWSRSDDFKTISKEFPSNISYKTEILDFAQNVSNVKVDITKATYIILKYASFNPITNWSYSNDENIIVGREAVQKNPIYKTEVIAFRTEGNIEKDFLQMQCYEYTYWKEGSKAVADNLENFFYSGYNPSNASYNSMAQGDKAYVNKEFHVILGGDGVNRTGKKDISTMTAVPSNVATKYLYGISSIKARLKDYTDYSIVYQILVNGYGWQKSASDGEESTYSHSKPLTAFRMVLVPKSEKEILMNYWNKDMGTYNIS